MSDSNSPILDGKSSVAGNRTNQMSMGVKFIFIALIGVLGLAFVWFNAMYSHQAQQKPETANTQYGGGGEQYVPPPAPPPAAHSALPEPTQATASPEVSYGRNQPSPASAAILAFSGGQGIGQALGQAVGQAAGDAGQGAPAGQAGVAPPDKSPLAAKLDATVMTGEKAGVINDPDMVITEGSMIPCVLQTAINSELAGLVVCEVPIDILGSTGNVVLLDRGTKIVGQIQNGLLQGQDRVFVVWTRAETPDHVIVTLNSPGSDELGRAGLPGAVDNHFWDRFGGALMLTLVQGGLQAGVIEAAGFSGGSSNSTSQQATNSFLYSAQSNGQSVAATALQNSINIPPTLTKNQGDTVSLIVAHDLDFSSVYKLQVSTTGVANGQ